MAAAVVLQVNQSITCHAWNADYTMVALSPGNAEVHIYRCPSGPEGAWERVHSLNKHEQLVSGIDWCHVTNKIVTCSHDRNAYVWSLENGEWQPTLVILRLNRAATDVKWSPTGNKFAVASGAKSVSVCYYEEQHNWWVSKLIRRRHDSTVTSVAWHPSNALLATGSTDFWCRVFGCLVKGVDDPAPEDVPFGEQPFAELLLETDAAGWVHDVAFSPSGKQLAFVAHDSTLNVIRDVGPNSIRERVALRQRPCTTVLFLSETVLIAGGHHLSPLLFTADETGKWSFKLALDEGKAAQAQAKNTQFSEAFGRFQGQVKRGEADTGERGVTTVHENCITQVRVTNRGGAAGSTCFSSTGLDGRLVLWDLATIEQAMAALKLSTA